MSYRRRASRPRSRVTFVGAVGAIGFAVYYFLDPELGPRRRREVIGAVQEALRYSQELLARLVEPPSEPAEPWRGQPEVTVERRVVAQEPARDLPSALHDQVTFFTVGEDSQLSDAVPAGVAAAPRLHIAEAPAHEAPGYAVAPPPEPRIIAYDAPEASLAHEPPAEAGETWEREPEHGSRRTLAAAVAAVVLLAAAAALGAWAVWGGDDGSSSQAGASPGAAQAIDLISQAGARSVPVAGSKGSMVLVVTPGGRAALIISGLTKAPAGKEYQAWVVAGGKPRSAGLFAGGQTRLVIPLAERIPKGAIFAVTLEKAGGVPAPTQSPQYTAKLS